jgi:ketosteroid isomerase-like protein
MHPRTVPVVVVAAVVACATSSAKSSDPGANARAEIDSLDARFNRWVTTNQLDSVIDRYYAPDAVLLLAGAPPARGADAIRKVYDGLMSAGAVRGGIKSSALVAADSIASDWGSYVLDIRAKNDSGKVIMADHGNYVTTFARRNGEWRAIYDINVTEIPAPAPAPAPATAKKR